MRPVTRLLAAAMIAAGCTNSPPVSSGPYVSTSLTRIQHLALAPGGGEVGEAIATALAERHNFVVEGSDGLAARMAAAGVRHVDGAMLGGLGFLRGSGIEGVLVVNAGAPETGLGGTSAHVLRVPDGARVAEARWTPVFRRITAALVAHMPERVSEQLADKLAGDLRR